MAEPMLTIDKKNALRYNITRTKNLTVEKFSGR
jgi:hypothetical protein